MNRVRLFGRQALYPLAALLAIMAAPGPAKAACDDSADPVVISGDCEDVVINGTKSAVTIEPNGNVTVLFAKDAVLIQPNRTITGTFLNQGTITSGFGDNGLVNLGTIATLQNDGLIESVDLSSKQAAIINRYEIGTLLNTGTIRATKGNLGAGAHAIAQGGHIGTLDNSGTISAHNSAIFFAAGITSRIDTLINSGLITGGIAGNGSNTFASAIVLGASNSIGTIINTGTIDHSVCDFGGTCYAAIDNDGGVIDTIINLGTLSSGNTGDTGYGIRNGITGTIGTLYNDQHDLKYDGKLPQNYVVIVYGATSYGKMSVTGATDSEMVFGVEAATPIGTTLYEDVLSGLTPDNLPDKSGTWGGGLFNNSWELTEASPSQWDLQLTSQAIVPSVESNSGESLAAAIIRTATEAASSDASPETIVPVLANGVTLQQAAQAMTPEQAVQLSDVHAEGYSSNLTIGLQQIGMISEAVTDRLDAGQLRSPRRHLWIDASAMRGTVNGYDGLSGFDYNLFHVIVGADIMRGSTGGFGVFAGMGQSDMTESEHVPQDFSTTSYFAGLYGGRDFASDVRLSASAGYIHGDNEATRYNADIGQFTGGAASSDYATDGAYGTLKISRAFSVQDGLVISPFAGAAYAQLWADEADETGGGDFNYAISDASAYTTVVFVGSGFRMPLAAAGGLSVVGFARLGYDMFADDDDAHSVTANSSLLGSFEQVGSDMGPVLSNVGLGIEGEAASGFAGRIGAVGALNSNGFQFGLGGELRW